MSIPDEVSENGREDHRDPDVCTASELSVQLDAHPISKFAYRLVVYDDSHALRNLRRMVWAKTWDLPPYRYEDHKWALHGHIWDEIRTLARRTGQVGDVMDPAN